MRHVQWRLVQRTACGADVEPDVYRRGLRSREPEQLRSQSGHDEQCHGRILYAGHGDRFGCLAGFR